MKRALGILLALSLLPLRLAGQETLTMEKAVATAVELNQSIQGARHDLESSSWGTKNAYSNFLPKVSFDAGFTRIDPETDNRANASLEFIRGSAGALGLPSSALANLRPFSYRDTYISGLTVVQPLYNGGAEIVGAKAAGAMETRSEYSYKDTEQDVIARVRIAYYNVLSAQEMVALATETVERSKRYLESTRRREDLGSRTKTDVARWEVQLASDEGNMIKAQNYLAISRLQLNEAMGVDLYKNYQLTPEAVDPDSVLTEADPGPRLTFADLEGHPAWSVMDANLQLAEAGVDKSWTAFKPRINMAFQYGWERNNTMAMDGYRPWALALTVSIPIFNGFGDFAELQKAKADLGKAQTQVESYRRGMLLQATNAQLSVRAARQRTDVGRKAQQQALDVLNSVTRRYESGGASNVDLIDAQTAYTAARVEFVTAMYDYYVAKVQLARATGRVSL